MNARQARALVGQRIAWDETLCANRGTYVVRTGTLHELRGKNALVDSDWRWLPQMTNLRAASAEDNRNARG